MKNPLDFDIGDSSLCREVKQFGFVRFGGLAEHVRALPYRRVESRDAAAVLRECCGTCSTKHRLLAIVAHESGRLEVQLTIGIYEMHRVFWRIALFNRGDAAVSTTLGPEMDRLASEVQHALELALKRDGAALDGQTPYERLLAKKSSARVLPKS